MVEEERRLFYVGVTRARRTLFLSAARRRLPFVRTVFNGRAAFWRGDPAGALPVCGGRLSRDGYPSAPKPQGAGARESAPGFRPGTRVRHPEYGAGVITRRTGAGSLAQIQVAFGDKSCLFLERYSNLTTLPETVPGMKVDFAQRAFVYLRCRTRRKKRCQLTGKPCSRWMIWPGWN
jgi:hypothetical protein